MNESSSTLRRVPASRDQVREALRRLAPGRPAGAAFHLALPHATSSGFSVRKDHGMWNWRGVSTAHQDPVDASCALAALGWADEDRFVDLNLDPVNWLKAIRTGAQVVIFGMDVLFDKPLLSVPVDVPTREALGIAGRICRNELNAGDVVTTAAGAYTIREGIGCWSLAPATT